MPAYFVDPLRGANRNNGHTQSTAWKDFSPLESVALQAGDQVEVLAAGPFRSSVLLHGTGSKDLPIRIRFAAGRYDLHPDGMTERLLDISNANDDRARPKRIAVLIENSSHLRIEGEGAEFVCRGKMIELCIVRSNDISVTGCTFDYHRPTVSEWSVVSSTRETADLRIHCDSTFDIEDGRIQWLGEGWSESTGLAQELIPETHQVERLKDPLASLRCERLDSATVRARGAHSLNPGSIYQIRNPYRDCVGVFLNRSRSIELRELHFAFMHGMGVLAQFCDGISLESITVAPRKGSGRASAAWADCTHFSGCRGTIRIHNCRFEGAHDDAVNIHGTHLRILEAIHPRKIRVAFVHRQTYGFQAFESGDRIEFVHADSLRSYGTATVLAVEMIRPREQCLTLDAPVPAECRENDVIENVTWTPQVEIAGCICLRIPTRGFLVTTRQRAVIERNTFIRLRHGIHIESDAENWFESGCVKDLTIRGNHFVNGKGPAIRISPQNPVANSAVHRNIRVLANHFDHSDSLPVVEAHGVTGLAIENNVMQTAPGEKVEDVVKIECCADVSISENVIEHTPIG